ncbi:hypothetical protein CEXT_495291 [Caerostris extrusa]|uniref:Uncharacterized protein n=1 Tax=Caerostris extrusa TaxID=172846 RepID=A0AAV4PF45_CAEEX|nr:hypothetical protein CEXT_495291 [Caerostris extrusa]
MWLEPIDQAVLGRKLQVGRAKRKVWRSIFRKVDFPQGWADTSCGKKRRRTGPSAFFDRRMDKGGRGGVVRVISALGKKHKLGPQKID